MAKEVDLASLDLRYECFRLKAEAVEGRLLVSIAEGGIHEPLEGVEVDGRNVLLNGFKRYRCARQLHLATVPYRSLGQDQAAAILGLLRTCQDRALSILEQAAFIGELKKTHHWTVADIAARLCRSKAWVSVRLGLLEPMSELVRRQLFAGAFPVYCYMYVLRRFMRLNREGSGAVDEFVAAVSGKGLSVRQIEELAQGFFGGPESLREEIRQGNLALLLERMRQPPQSPDACSPFERVLLQELVLVQKSMQRVIGNSQEQHKLLSRAFHAQCHLLTASILSHAPVFVHTLKQLHDRNRQA